MMSFWSSFWCSYIAVVVFFASFGQAIKCFQCSSVNETECENVKSNDTSVDFYRDCDENYNGKQPFCRKTVQTIIDHGYIVRVHRSCGWEEDTHHRRPCYKYENDFHFEIVCVCYSDACNSAPAILAPWTILAATTGTVLLWR